MRVLILDTIHGAEEIGRAFADRGHDVDIVDIYRGTTPDVLQEAHGTHYDLVAAPVHTDPDHPLVRRAGPALITHHAAVRRLLGPDCPRPLIEITGARGKTTTAHALAHILGGPGVLHTSAGTFAFPTKQLLFQKSIAPSSVLAAARSARTIGGFLVAEESLGVTGAGDLAIITSHEDYPIAARKKRAMDAKAASFRYAFRLLAAPGVVYPGKNVVHLEDIARFTGDACSILWQGSEWTVKNPLFLLPPYRVPLMLAAGAAALLGRDPAPLATFEALPGRLAVTREGQSVTVDNSNSGTNPSTTACAARYARYLAPGASLTLVIGQAEGDGKVCEGFTAAQVAQAIEAVGPSRVILVGKLPSDVQACTSRQLPEIASVCNTFAEARDRARELDDGGATVLSVKAWR
jgi:UDP-N-acetylmuramyl pentapeptide synthase